MPHLYHKACIHELGLQSQFPFVCLQSPRASRNSPNPTRSVRRPTPLLLGCGCRVVVGAAPRKVSRTLAFVTHGELSGTVTVRVVPPTVWTFSGVVR